MLKINNFNSKSTRGPRIQLNTGHSMPLVGLGTYKIVGQDAIDITVDAALNCGYRQFDTAKLYKNEKELGNAFQKFLSKYGLKRDDIFITTKFFAVSGSQAAMEVPKLVEESLTNIQTSYLDLVLIHYPKPEENANDDAESNANSRKETWLALEQIPTEKIRSIGVSNYEVRHLEEVREFAKRVPIPAINQVEYHPHFRRTDIKQYCDKNGIHFQAYSSLARQEPKLLNDPAVMALIEKYKTTAQTILLSFATSQGVGIVPKSTSPERIRNNLNCLDLTLSAEDLQTLNGISVNQNYIRPTPWLVL